MTKSQEVLKAKKQIKEAFKKLVPLHLEELVRMKIRYDRDVHVMALYLRFGETGLGRIYSVREIIDARFPLMEVEMEKALRALEVAL